jgi:hypothetical protein
MWNISGVVSYQFNGKIRHASRHSKIRSAAADQRAGLSHKNGNYSHSRTTLLAVSSTYRLFPVPQAEIHLERMKIRHHGRDKRKFAEGPEGDTETSVPGLF